MVFIFEHELVLAATALRRCHKLYQKDSTASTDEKVQALREAIDAATAALWHVEEGRGLMLTSARALFGEPDRISTAPDSSRELPYTGAAATPEERSAEGGEPSKA
jgi:hypothetical protein